MMSTRRYIVKRTGLKWGVYAGTGTRALLTFWRWRTAERVAWDLQTAFADGKYVGRAEAPWPALADQMVCLSPCEKHRGLPFQMTISAPAAPMRTVCPICTPPRACKPS